MSPEEQAGFGKTKQKGLYGRLKKDGRCQRPDREPVSGQSSWTGTLPKVQVWKRKLGIS